MNNITELSTATEYINKKGIKITSLSNINFEKTSAHFLIYKLTNQFNGMFYIGQHLTLDPFDNYMGSGTYIKHAITEYGVSSFTKEILFDFDSYDETNAKEEELVPEISCHKYNPMCYNLTQGGNSGNKFASKTPEEITEIFERVQATIRNAPEDKKQERFQHQSDASKAVWAQLTDEERAHRSQQQSKRALKMHENRTSVEQAEINTKISKTKVAFTPERREEIRLKIQHTLDSLSDEEKLARHLVASKAAIEREARKTPEEHAIQNEHQRQTWENKTYEEIQEGVNKWRISMNQRTDAEKAETTRKRLESLNNRSNEEKTRTAEKLAKTLANIPQEEKDRRAAAQAAKLLGRRKMVHPANPTKKIMVEPHKIQEYLSQGYVFTKPRPDDISKYSN